MGRNLSLGGLNKWVQMMYWHSIRSKFAKIKDQRSPFSYYVVQVYIPSTLLVIVSWVRKSQK